MVECYSGQMNHHVFIHAPKQANLLVAGSLERPYGDNHYFAAHCQSAVEYTLRPTHCSYTTPCGHGGGDTILLGGGLYRVRGTSSRVTHAKLSSL